MVKVDDLFEAQYRLYGYHCENKYYLPTQLLIYRLTSLYYNVGKGKLISSQSITKFKTIAKFLPHFEVMRKKLDFIPDYKKYKKMLKDLLSFLDQNEELDDDTRAFLKSETERLIKEYIELLMVGYKGRNLLSKYDDCVRKKFLDCIINCPKVDVLLRVNELKDLSFILFDHPDYRKEKYKDVNYITKVLLAGGDADEGDLERQNLPLDVEILFPMLARVNSLTLKDFDKIGLGDYIDLDGLRVLKEWISKRIYKYLTHEGRVKTQKRVAVNKKVARYIFDALYMAYTAVAVHEGNPFIKFTKVSRVFRSRHFSRWLATDILMGKASYKKISLVLKRYILEFYTLPLEVQEQDSWKLGIYRNALDALNLY